MITLLGIVCPFVRETALSQSLSVSMRIPGRPGRRRGGPSPPKGDLRVVHAIVGSFLGDDDVVDMAFAQARGGDFHHLGFFEEFLNGRRAAVALSLIHISTFLMVREDKNIFIYFILLTDWLGNLLSC